MLRSHDVHVGHASKRARIGCTCLSMRMCTRIVGVDGQYRRYRQAHTQPDKQMRSSRRLADHRLNDSQGTERYVYDFCNAISVYI